MSRQKKWLNLSFSLLFVPVVAEAAGMTGARKIIEIGCHNDSSGICFVTIDGAPTGGGGCVSSSIRWDTQTIGGKNNFALLSAANLAGKSINFYIPDACFAPQPTYPTFGFLAIVQ